MSNFAETKFEDDEGVSWPTVEHYMCAQKHKNNK